MATTNIPDDEMKLDQQIEAEDAEDANLTEDQVNRDLGAYDGFADGGATPREIDDLLND